MTEPNSSNHWDSLASELGAETPLQPEEPRQPVTPAQPPAPAQKPAPRPARRERSTTAPPTASWDSLASELGLAPPPPAAPPVAPRVAPPVVPPVKKPIAPLAESPVAAPPAAEPGRRTSAVPEAAEDSPNFFDERFDFEEPYDLLEAGEAPAAGPETPESSAESTDEPTEKRPRRRRRRRGRGRGRDSEQQDSREKALPEGSGDRSDVVVAEVVEEPDRINVAPEGEEIDIDRPRDEAAKSEERRSKRRRPRRGKKKPHGGEPGEAAAGKIHDAESVPESDESDEMEAVGVGASADDGIELGEADDADEGPSARLGFRGIPTWDEAIGMIVDKNLEARAKRSGGGSRPSRGKRPPRDNRGGGKPRS